MDVDINNNTSVSDCDIDEIKVEINEIDESNDKKNDSIMCDECPATFSNNDKLVTHKKRKHLRHICGECGYVLFGRDKLHDHVRNHKSAVCSDCGLVVKSRSLKAHMNTCNKQKKVKKGRKRHVCDSCEFSADTEKRLNVHKRKHEKKGLVHKCDFCDYSSKKLMNKNRHQKSCPAKKRQTPPAAGIVTNKKLLDMFAGSHCSISDFNDIVGGFIDHFGSEWFESNAKKCVADYCKSMNVFSTAETVQFTDSSGKQISRTLAYVSDPKALFEKVLEGRNIADSKIVLGCDYGKEKLIVTASLYDKDDLTKECNGVKPSSPQAAMLLACGDFVPENHNNLTVIFDKLGFPLQMNSSFRFIADLKLSNYIVGLHTCNSIFGCIYGECCKMKNGKPSGRGGRWKKGKERTFNSCKAHHHDWME